MSHEASNYAKKLGRGEVTRRQKLLLMVLADYHNTARRAAWPSLPTLAEESLMDPRECRRVLKELEAAGILERIPGRGRGEYSEYRFVEIDGKEGHITPFSDSAKEGQREGQKGGQKRGQNAPAIRKELEPEPEQRQNHHACGALSQPLRDWLAVKAKLLPAEREWLRPMYLLRVMGGNTLLLALPPSGRIIAAARSKADLLNEELRAFGYAGHQLTRFPDDYELRRIADEFPEFFEALPEALRKRVSQHTGVVGAENYGVIAAGYPPT